MAGISCAVALTSLAFYFWGVRSGWRTPAIIALEQGRDRRCGKILNRGK